MNDNEPKIVVPKRLIKSLIDCINLQRKVTISNERTVVLETQSLIDSTLVWANSFLTLNTVPSLDVTLDEALEFVKVQKPTETCDFLETHKCREIVVEPNYEGE